MRQFDLCVIGSGPAGQKAAIQAAKLGKSVCVAELQSVVGGVAVAWRVVVSLYYLRLSPRLAGVMLLVFASFAGASHLLWTLAGPTGTWAVAGAVFIGAWAGQFVGHLIEGRRPSFFTDLQYLLIGPRWVVDKRLGIA